MPIHPPNPNPEIAKTQYNDPFYGQRVRFALGGVEYMVLPDYYDQFLPPGAKYPNATEMGLGKVAVDDTRPAKYVPPMQRVDSVQEEASSNQLDLPSQPPKNYDTVAEYRDYLEGLLVNGIYHARPSVEIRKEILENMRTAYDTMHEDAADVTKLFPGIPNDKHTPLLFGLEPKSLWRYKPKNLKTLIEHMDMPSAERLLVALSLTKHSPDKEKELPYFDDIFISSVPENLPGMIEGKGNRQRVVSRPKKGTTYHAIGVMNKDGGEQKYLITSWGLNPLGRNLTYNLGNLQFDGLHLRLLEARQLSAKGDHQQAMAVTDDIIGVITTDRLYALLKPGNDYIYLPKIPKTRKK